jgi:hypothetical protein
MEGFPISTCKYHCAFYFDRLTHKKIGKKFNGLHRASVLAYFTHLKCQNHIEDDIGDVRYIFTEKHFVLVKMTPGTFYPPYYARI